jgi:hypothetical protein
MRINRTALTLVELLVIIAIIGVLVALLLPNVRTSREAARRNQCQNYLRQIAVALKMYEDHHRMLPPAYTTDSNGKPLHSWRALIIPYMEIGGLHDSIDPAKSWDDPANCGPLQTCLPMFQCPSVPFEHNDNRTNYLAVVTPRSCIRATQPRNLADLSGASKKLLVIDVDIDHAVPWMAPVDADEELVLGIGGPKAKSPHPSIMQAAFLDGSVQALRTDMPADERRELISIAASDKAEAETPE